MQPSVKTAELCKSLMSLILKIFLSVRNVNKTLDLIYSISEMWI